MDNEEQSVPLNDLWEMRRSGSMGSNKDVDLTHDGEQDSLDFRIQAVDASGIKKISLWHDVSLVHLDGESKSETPYLNFVCEIPKFSRYLPFYRTARDSTPANP
jgi:hypothetical protein